MTKRKRYADEFKREAVRLVTEHGYTQAETARSLGINANFIQRWPRKFAPDAPGTETMNESEQQELKRLREEVRKLRMERDILKKVAPGKLGRGGRVMTS
ncbi:MAG: transposase [Planctomycetales bacterium]